MGHRRIGLGSVRYAVWPWAFAGVAALTASSMLPSATPLRPYRPPAGIELTAGTPGSALFAVDDLVPGHPVTNCLAVTFHQALPGSTIRLYAVESGTLAAYLAVTVRTGGGGTRDDCAGFVATATPYQGRLTGLAAGPAGLPMLRLPSAEGTVTVQVTVSVLDTAAAQGRSTRFDLVLTMPPAPGGPPAPPAPDAGRPASLLHKAVAALLRFARAAALPLLKAGSVGLLTSLLGVMFLLVQNRIDRRDPKLALAPVRPPAQLTFIERSAVL
jgi:hypothetical protein